MDNKKPMFLYYYGHGKTAHDLCEEAILNVLFKEGWTLAGKYVDCIKGKSTRKYRNRPYYLIAIVRDYNKAIGACLLAKNNISMFIKPKYRRMGLASELMDVLIDLYHIDKEKIIAGPGVRGSSSFWKRYPFIELQ